ncbi:MAG: peptidase, partial [Candidatus Adiutrix sp.]
MPPITFDLSLLLPVSNTISAPYEVLQFFLIAGFVLHILAMNIIVGLTCILLVQRVFPLKNHCSEQVITYPLWSFLPKGLALVVNFGVVPLLFVQVAYGYLVYNADIIMGVWWLSVMMVVMLAYYGLYVSTSYSNISSGARTLALFVTVALLLCNAFIFVNKATLV